MRGRGVGGAGHVLKPVVEVELCDGFQPELGRRRGLWKGRCPSSLVAARRPPAGSAAEEDRQLGVAQGMPGGAAQDQLAHPCMAVAAHHHEIGS